MSIVRLYRDVTAEDGTRRFEYREAWCEPGSGQFTVHHGRVGAVGTVGDQPVADDAEGEELLAAFVAQGREEGFAELADDALTTLSVTYRLRGRTSTPIEAQHADALRSEITHQLAWRGLGDVEDVAEEEGRLVLIVRTPHAAKAEAEIPAAAKRAHGVQPNKVEVHRGDLRPADASARGEADAEADADVVDAAAETREA